MKQRVSVRAIVQQDGKTLLLRRSNGRESILGKYELPGGKLGYGEQPEDALRRYLHDDAGLHIKSAQLFDAVTYIDHDDNSLQYIVITYNVGLAPLYSRNVKLSGNYDRYRWQKLSKEHQEELTDLTQLIFGIIQQEAIADESIEVQQANDDKNTSDIAVTIYADGGSRGNPGPSAAGYIMLNDQQQVIAQDGEYLGITTNNQAEYQGVRLGLEKALEYGASRVDFRLDSMLVVNQMNGLYRIKNRELWPVHELIRGLIKQFHKVTFSHVQREFNQLADGMVNKTLDAHLATRNQNSV
jgi:ribonuclease HI/ADP-ribose pyrophosphatase YjhB (NUDIX family)